MLLPARLRNSVGNSAPARGVSSTKPLGDALIAKVRFDTSMGELERDPDGPWLKVADVHVKLVSNLAARLRLAPQSRLDRKQVGPATRNDAGGEKPWD